MKIRMLQTRVGAANPVGSRTRLYRKGETYAMTEAWQGALAESFVAAGWAEPLEAKAQKSKTKTPAKRRRVIH